MNKKDVDVFSTISDLHYTDDFVFSSEQGLNIAAAFTAYDTDTEWILDETYGEILFNHFSWGPQNGTYISERVRLDQHNCTAEELGLEGDPSSHQFYPLHENSRDHVNLFQKKFICFSKEDMRIQGDYNTEKTRQLNIQLKKCRGTGCKNDTEITQYFRNKFIMLIYN